MGVDRRKIWIVADTHLGYDRLIERGFRPKTFETQILAAMTQCIRPCDIVIHLGDLVWNRATYWTDQFMEACCGATVWLIRGNHDLSKSHFWYIEHGFDFCADEMVMDKHGHRIIFTHKPVVSSRHTLNIHGHLHNNRNRHIDCDFDNRQYLISMEDENYHPVDLDRIVREFYQRFPQKQL